MKTVRRFRTAEQLVSELGITSIDEISIDAIAEYCNAHIVYESYEGSSGQIIGVDGSAIISVNSNLSLNRQRFTAAHELGHWMCDRGPASIAHRDTGESIELGWSPSSREVRANKFAAHLLMPKELFKPRCLQKSPSLAFFNNLAKEFKVSFLSAAIRYVECSGESCAIITSKSGVIHSFTRSKDFGFWIPVGEKLDKNTLAYDFFAKRKLWPDMQSVDASSWLEGRFVSDAMIQEETRQIDNFDATMSLIWIDKHIAVHCLVDSCITPIKQEQFERFIEWFLAK